MRRFLFTLILLFTICININAQAQHSHWTATYYGNTYKSVRRTANGDVFNMNAMTCAAPRHYKFGTKLKITNLSNNKSVIVTVTDRGEFGKRTIDLTYGAFGKIASHKAGRIKIKVEVVTAIFPEVCQQVDAFATDFLKYRSKKNKVYAKNYL